jgi:ribonuclease HI
MKLSIFTDGGSRGNPWESWIGVVIIDENEKILEKRYSYLWFCTNNFAEYSAVLFWLKRAIELEAKQIEMFMDSKLVASQLSWVWKVKNDDLKWIYFEIKDIINKNKIKIVFSWIPREKNKEADRLANKAMDVKQ